MEETVRSVALLNVEINHIYGRLQEHIGLGPLQNSQGESNKIRSYHLSSHHMRNYG